MLREHFAKLQPRCPYCRVVREQDSALYIGEVAREADGDIREGVLICSNPLCQREHPILDGVPVVVTDGPSWAASQLSQVMQREDLTPFAESMLGDLAGAGSNFDRDRGNNGIYAETHWGGADPSYLQLVRAGMELLSAPPTGTWIDVGCSVGRGTFELARATGELTVGLDLNFSMLRIAEGVRGRGRVRYRRRRVGLVFDSVYEAAPELPRENVSFWCADAAAIPFATGSFRGAFCLNLLDCVPSPLGLLVELGRLVMQGGEVALSTPFDWAVGATASSAWMGGHSQRGPQDGSSLLEFRRILSAECAAGIDTGLLIEAERDGVPWRLRVNERSVTEYAVYFAGLRRKG